MTKGLLQNEHGAPSSCTHTHTHTHTQTHTHTNTHTHTRTHATYLPQPFPPPPSFSLKNIAYANPDSHTQPQDWSQVFVFLAQITFLGTDECFWGGGHRFRAGVKSLGIPCALCPLARHTFCKVLHTVPLYAICTRALSFPNFCQAPASRRLRPPCWSFSFLLCVCFSLLLFPPPLMLPLPLSLPLPLPPPLPLTLPLPLPLSL